MLEDILLKNGYICLLFLCGCKWNYWIREYRKKFKHLISIFILPSTKFISSYNNIKKLKSKKIKIKIKEYQISQIIGKIFCDYCVTWTVFILLTFYPQVLVYKTI